MKHWLIGDVQGCFASFKALLSKMAFDPSNDRISFAGDLINRGENDFAMMSWILEHRHCVDTVLGNHDLHFLAQKFTHSKPGKKESYRDVFNTRVADDFSRWLIGQPLVRRLTENTLLVHAGIPSIWSTEQALTLSEEVTSVLSNKFKRRRFFARMYGNQPSQWVEHLRGQKRLRIITNYLTRMRFVTDKGELEFKTSNREGPADPRFQPWYSLPREDQLRVYFGHWAALEGDSGRDDFVSLDGGCVWGGHLIAEEWQSGLRIEQPHISTELS